MVMSQGVKGVACIWRANEEYVDRCNLALELPNDLVRLCGHYLTVTHPVAKIARRWLLTAAKARGPAAGCRISHQYYGMP